MKITFKLVTKKNKTSAVYRKISKEKERSKKKMSHGYNTKELVNEIQQCTFTAQ